jgi:nitrogen fixation NifU-like protein
MLKGKSLAQAKEVTDKQIATALELPPVKLHCSVLAEASIAKAIENYREKNG